MNIISHELQGLQVHMLNNKVRRLDSVLTKGRAVSKSILKQRENMRRCEFQTVTHINVRRSR